MTERMGAAARMTRRITTSATTAVGGAGPMTRSATTTAARTSKVAAAAAGWMILRATTMAVRGPAAAVAAVGWTILPITTAAMIAAETRTGAEEAGAATTTRLATPEPEFEPAVQHYRGEPDRAARGGLIARA